MNKYFRLIWTYLISRNRSKMEAFDECSTPFRCWPNDLDVLGHMNNGVYFSLQDLARTDYMIRIGALKPITDNGWYPVVTAERIRFKKSLKPFQKFEIRTKLSYWDDKCIYLIHTFVANGEAYAWGTIRTRFLKKAGGLVNPEELLQAIGKSTQAPPIPEFLKSWIESEEAHESLVQGKR